MANKASEIVGKTFRDMGLGAPANAAPPAVDPELQKHAKALLPTMEEAAKALKAGIAEAKKLAAGKKGDREYISRAVETCMSVAGDSDESRYFYD